MTEMGTEEKKVFTLEEVAKHKSSKDCWLIINGKVYDVTKFLDDHPGGDDPLVQATGEMDASDDFEDVGHSNNAWEVMKEYYIGEIDVSSLPPKTKYQGQVKTNQVHQVATVASGGLFIKLLQFLVPIAILSIAFGIRSYTRTL